MAKHKPKYKRIAQLKTATDFREYLTSLGIDLPFDETLLPADQSPYQKTFNLNSGRVIGNRFCILPMEGWDGTPDGRPSEYTKRRWKNFAISGAKLLWGCEAVAVRHDGRANPHQLLIDASRLDEYKKLFESIYTDHRERFGKTDDLVVGFQLTHSGRFCKPNDQKKMEPQILYPHPVLNKKYGLPDDYPVMTDDDIDRLVDDFVKAAVLTQRAGFHFIDLKHCHGYLGHELLGARARDGKYGGPAIENRMRFMRNVIEAVRAEVPGLLIAVRFSAFDLVPYRKKADGVGEPDPDAGGVNHGFGLTHGEQASIDDAVELLIALEGMDVRWICVSGGSPYYNPHTQRPALFPPLDGYLPPEDPLRGVARQIDATARLKQRFPKLAIVGSAYSYLQEWLPNVAQHSVAKGLTDFVGLGRMVLAYPDLPADVLGGGKLRRKSICRTFSDCTTGPRLGMVSGCYPLDPFYMAKPEAAIILKKRPKAEE